MAITALILGLKPRPEITALFVVGHGLLRFTGLQSDSKQQIIEGRQNRQVAQSRCLEVPVCPAELLRCCTRLRSPDHSQNFRGQSRMQLQGGRRHSATISGAGGWSHCALHCGRDYLLCIHIIHGQGLLVSAAHPLLFGRAEERLSASRCQRYQQGHREESR